MQQHLGLDERAAWSRSQVLTLLKWSPAGLVLAALAFILVTLLLEGHSGPSWTLLYAFSSKLLGLS